ncbi:MAG: efflux RND transporter periplasmic adaptor subunit [Gemmatimonadota bacterium]
MRREAWILIAIGGVVLAAAAWWLLRPGGERPAGPPSAADMEMAGRDGAGMAMEMGEGGTIRLTPEQIRTFGVTFGTVERRPIEKTIRAVGLVTFDETRVAIVAPKIGGWVERLHVDFTGKPVSRGFPLLEIYSPELVSAQEELLLAASLEKHVGASGVEGVAQGGRDLFESAKRRLTYWDISDAQVAELLRTGRVRKTLTLHAPVGGIVLEKNVFEGQAVQPGEALYKIADLSEVWVEAEIFEADLALVHEGMPVTVTFAGLPGMTYSGRVEYVYPTLEEGSRTMRARVALPNPGGRIRPGMYATVTLERALGETLTIPRTAILRTGEAAVAFVDMGEGALMPHELTLGMEGDEHVEVLAGVEPGMRVVTSAQYLIDSESNLAEVMRAMMAQMGAADVGRRPMPGME